MTGGQNENKYEIETFVMITPNNIILKVKQTRPPFQFRVHVKL
jgi:hypothetical protein